MKLQKPVLAEYTILPELTRISWKESNKGTMNDKPRSEEPTLMDYIEFDTVSLLGIMNHFFD